MLPVSLNCPLIRNITIRLSGLYVYVNSYTCSSLPTWCKVTRWNDIYCQRLWIVHSLLSRSVFSNVYSYDWKIHNITIRYSRDLSNPLTVTLATLSLSLSLSLLCVMWLHAMVYVIKLNETVDLHCWGFLCQYSIKHDWTDKEVKLLVIFFCLFFFE